MAHIIFDIGGTKMRVARRIDNSTFSEPKKIATPQNGQEGISALLELAHEVGGGEPIESMSGGIAAVFEGERIVNSSNLAGWVGVDFGEISKEAGFRVTVKNDAAVVGLGEVHHGSGRGRTIAVYITVSTGVGGARMVDGNIDASTFGFEPGHQILDIDGLRTLEDLVSGKSFEARFGKKPYEVTESEVWEEAAKNLAIGLHNITVHWSPEVIILGGPMMIGDPAIPIEHVRDYFKEISTIFTKLPEIEPASLEDNGGLYGALALSTTA